MPSQPACSKRAPFVVVYAAQDRIFSEPVFRSFTEQSGIEVRAVHDNEATKTVGLANRLALERSHPQADLWWSNEEMRTRQLVRQGVLDQGWQSFGHRSRVLVVPEGAKDALPAAPDLSLLTNSALKGRIAIAFPVFGTTATHFLVLRQRWGAQAWEQWCRALALNRPLIVDGNSVVVRLVARGDARIGLTDSDDVSFARREGLKVTPLSLPPADGLWVPNTIAYVTKSPRRDPAQQLAEYLIGTPIVSRLIEAGALEGADGLPTGDMRVNESQWERLLDELDPAVTTLREIFVR